MIRHHGRDGATPSQGGDAPRLHRGKWNRIWAASITAALSLGGASAWAQPSRLLPPCPALAVSGQERPAAPAAPTIILTAATTVPDAPPPQAGAPRKRPRPW